MKQQLNRLVALIVVAFSLVAARTSPAKSFKSLYSFAGPPDGAGGFYGTTSRGGDSEFGDGTIFRVDSSGKETVLYTFCSQSNCTDGSEPSGGLVADTAGILYGTTYQGGAYGFGTVFQLDPKTGVQTVLYDFQGLAKNDGANPGYGMLWRSPVGLLYGTTYQGGRACKLTPYGCGTVFYVDPKKRKETVLYRFKGQNDGGLPLAGVARSTGGATYGTTTQGGTNNQGVVFDFSAGILHVLHSFTRGIDGGFPQGGGLLLFPNGNLYGTTNSGGPFGTGVVFKLAYVGNGHWKETVLNSAVASPGYSGFITDSSYKRLYGTSFNGGPQGYGFVFRMDLQGRVTSLYNFTGGADGGFPEGTLLIEGANNLYGTTFAGGEFQWGTVFRLIP